MLPWQLLLAQPPGPLYLPVGALCAKRDEASTRHTSTCHTGLAVLRIRLASVRIQRVNFCQRLGLAYTHSESRNQLTVWYAPSTTVQVLWGARVPRSTFPVLPIDVKISHNCRRLQRTTKGTLAPCSTNSGRSSSSMAICRRINSSNSRSRTTSRSARFTPSPASILTFT